MEHLIYIFAIYGIYSFERKLSNYCNKIKIRKNEIKENKINNFNYEISI